MPCAVNGQIDHIAMCNEQPHRPISFVFRRHNKTVITSLAVNDYHLLSEPVAHEGADDAANDANPGASIEEIGHAFGDITNVDNVPNVENDASADSDIDNISTSDEDNSEPINHNETIHIDQTNPDHESTEEIDDNNNIFDIINNDDESMDSP